MANAYSTDLRERVVLTINEGASCHESAEIHRVSVSSAIRWYQSGRCSGSVEAKPSGGSHSPLDDHAEAILTIIEEQNDRTLDEIVAEMHRRRLPGSRTALFRFLGRHGITRKKRSCMPVSEKGQMWQGRGSAGSASKAFSTRRVWSS